MQNHKFGKRQLAAKPTVFGLDFSCKSRWKLPSFAFRAMAQADLCVSVWLPTLLCSSNTSRPSPSSSSPVARVDNCTGRLSSLIPLTFNTVESPTRRGQAVGQQRMISATTSHPNTSPPPQGDTGRLVSSPWRQTRGEGMHSVFSRWSGDLQNRVLFGALSRRTLARDGEVSARCQCHMFPICLEKSISIGASKGWTEAL
ncbi:hypothetical protein LY78DRAFT_330262 [Colletotrichum sublineola]|nr:hypothetical protein LY78DRAFT_330262 [Colletotrichum sublineola]